MTHDALRTASTDDRVAWLAATASRLLRETAASCEALAESTGLSAPMVTWGARTTLDTMTPDALHGVATQARRAGGDPISAVSIVLAGNLFTAAARAVIVPLLLGIPVKARASSRELLFPTMLRDMLARVNPDLGEAVSLEAFGHGDIEREAALIEGTAATAVYGADATIDAIKRRHPNTRFIAHGHGVSAAYCGPEALSDACGADTIANLALDVCAYDQRGCLSPQVVYVAADSEPELLAFAERFANEGLARLAVDLPRGPLPLDVGAAQAQWRGIAEVEGLLIAGNTYGIAIQPPSRLRWSPGYRNVTLALVRNVGEAVAAMDPLGHALKCVGADPSSSAVLRTELERSGALSAYVCPLGAMQTPPLDAPADGHPIWHGLLQ